jgi:predicted SAM-dependent methyltransferase
MAITIPKPDSLHSVLPREYDFIPYDRLCFAYFQIGEHQKSYNANLKALESNPCGTDLERCSYNDSFLKNILNEKRNGEGKKLNLGCGSKKIEDYTNCDVVKTQYSDEVFPLTNIPYTDGSISAIYCEHVLEHLSHQESHQAISEMSRVLKQGGELQLFIPDLEKCCEKYLTSNDMTNGFDAKEWFKYTIFGFQKDANGVPADYQFHKTGFSKNDITTLLEQNDFVIDYCENY